MRNYALAEQQLTNASELAQARPPRYNAAFREFERVIASHAGYAKAHYWYGSALCNAGRYPEAVEQFRKVVEIDPAYPIDVSKLSQALDHDARQEEDLRQLQQAVDEHNHADLFHRWGRVLVVVAYYDQAIEQFKQALTKTPKLDIDVEDLRRALDDSELTEQQVKSFQETVDQLSNPFAWNTWGKTLRALHKYPAAIDQFNKAIAVHDQWAEVYYNRGVAFQYLEGDAAYQEAVQMFQRALELDDHFVRAYVQLGQALHKLDQHAQASATFQRAMEIAPSVEYLVPWQAAIRGLPNPDSAIAEYQHALDKNHLQWKDARQNVYALWAAFLLSLGRAEQSALQYACALVNGHLSPALFINSPKTKLQQTLAELPDPTNAIIEIQPRFDLADQSDLYLQWGAILARLNKDDLALQQLSRALRALANKGQAWPWVSVRNLIQAFNARESRSKAEDLIQETLRQQNQPQLWVQWRKELAVNLSADHQALVSYGKVLILQPFSRNDIDAFTRTLKRSKEQATIVREIQAAVTVAASAKVFYTWGQILENMQEHSIAISQYQQAIQRKPDYAEAYYAIGKLYIQQGRHREARAQLQKAVEYRPDDAAVFYDWARALLESGRYEEAIGKYIEAIPRFPDAFKQIQLVLERLKWDDALVARFQRTVDTNSTDKQSSARCSTQWGAVLMQLGHHEQSIQQHRRAVELDPDLSDSYTNWRKAIGKAGVTPERIREYDQKLKENRDDAGAYAEWGNFLFNLNWYEQAAEKYQKALERDTKHSNGRTGWISCLLNLNDIEQASKAAHQLHAYAPRDGYFRLAEVAFWNGKYGETIQQIEQGLLLQPNIEDFYYMKWAWALYKDGQEERALRKFEEAIQKNPGSTDIYLDYGNMLLEMNRYEEAAIQFQAAIKLDANYAYAHHNLAVIANNQGQYEAAWGKWMQALQAYQNAPPAIDRVVDSNRFVPSEEFYYHAMIVRAIQHKNDQAEQILKQGLAFNPYNTLVLGGLVDLYWEQKQECLGDSLEVARKKSEYHWEAMRYFRQAERLLQKRLQGNRDFTNLNELGDLYLTVEDYEAAGRCFEEACKKDKRSSLSYAKLGVIQLRLKQPAKALEPLQEALRRNPDDLDVQSSLAEATLRVEQLDEAEAAYRKILAIAPNHVQSLIGLAEVCTAQGAQHDTDRFYEAIEYFVKALEVAEKEKIRSKYLKTHEKAAIYYSRGYARVQLYENSGLRRDTVVLKQALQDFRKCREFVPTHQKAIRAIEKIDGRMGYSSPQRLTEMIGPVGIFMMALIIFLAVQLAFFILPIFNQPELRITETSLQAIAKQLPQEAVQQLAPLKNQVFSSEAALLNALPALGESTQKETLQRLVLEHMSTATTLGTMPKIETGYYALLTFGALIFMVVGLYLPQIQKLSGAGIVLEKSSIDQAQAGGTLGIGN